MVRDLIAANCVARESIQVRSLGFGGLILMVAWVLVLLVVMNLGSLPMIQPALPTNHLGIMVPAHCHRHSTKPDKVHYALEQALWASLI